MTDSSFTFSIQNIRNAIKHAHRDFLANETADVSQIHDMIDSLTQDMKRQADTIDTDSRGKLASDLSALVGELEILESLIEQRLTEENS